MSSAIPAAVTSFTALATDSLPSGTIIWFGAQLAKYTTPLTLQITGISGDSEWRELGPSYRREEAFNIMCNLSSWAGDQDFPSRMTETMDAFETLSLAVYNDPQLTGTLGGTGSAGAVRDAEIKDYLFVPTAMTNGGSLGRLTFDVHCVARVTTIT